MLATAEKAPLQITNNVDLVSKNYERVYFRNFSCRQTAQHLGGIVYNSFFTMRNKKRLRNTLYLFNEAILA
jgi:hypothetical protein